ncbi:MAG: hypothetical protein ACXWAT_02055 [Methylobacter sp.]
MTSSPKRSLEQIDADLEAVRNAPYRSRQQAVRNAIEIERERGLLPMPLESEALLRRVRALDWSGEFLGEALISAYWKDQPFNNSLFQIINLDAEGIRLFHQILHIRLIPGWRDDVLYALVLEVKQLLAKGSGHVPSITQ